MKPRLGETRTSILISIYTDITDVLYIKNVYYYIYFEDIKVLN